MTIHVSLRRALDTLSTDEIVRVALTTAAALRRDFGIAAPRLAVAGLNPHAGEAGHMGDEEGTSSCRRSSGCAREGLDVVGPMPPDTMFTAPARARYDAAICMYHDQALIPLKTLDMAHGVNVTLGLRPGADVAGPRHRVRHRGARRGRSDQPGGGDPTGRPHRREPEAVMRVIRLGVNIDHVATVRNARGGSHPDPLDAALAAVAAGADGITLHLREDRRHIRDDDLARIRAAVAAPINLEMAATAEMLAIARAARPHAACIVPERRAEVTTEGGLDAAGQQEQLAPIVTGLRRAGIRVSLFIDPAPEQIAAAVGSARRWWSCIPAPMPRGARASWSGCGQAPRWRPHPGWRCHAGHGLTYGNVGAVAAIPEVAELNIGHFLVGEAILDGLPAVVLRMRASIDAAA